MIYKVPLLKLKKIANPFEQVAFDDTPFPIEPDQIKTAIESNNIFEDENESATQNHIRRIAYMASNYENQIIKINLTSNSSGWIVEEGSEYLAASIYNKVKFILADIQGSEKSIISLLGQLETVPQPVIKNNDNIIHWDNNLPVSQWSNIKYIIPVITKGLKDGNLPQVLLSIDNEVWEDPDSLKNIVSNLRSEVSSIPQHVLMSEKLVDAVKDDYLAFGALWNFYYKDHYTQDNLLSACIKEKIFNNVDMCVNLLNQSYKIGFLYNLFSDEVKNHPDIIDKLYKDPTEKPLIDLLTPQSFEKEENVLRFLRKIPYAHLEEKEYIYKNWINDKDKLINFFKDKDIACMGSFYEYIPKSITQDKDFILACMPKCLDVITDLSHELMTDLDIVQAMIRNKATNLIPKDILYSIENTDIIGAACKDDYLILLNPETPKEWLLDDDIIACVPAQHLNNLPEETLNRFLSSEENCLHVISNSPQMYKHFPDTSRRSHAVVMSLLEVIDERNSLLPFIDLIPKSLWSSKEFCLMAMRNINVIDFVPKPFFNQKDFLTEFFSRIDNNHISHKAIAKIPIQIQHVLEENKIEENYENFLSSYLLQQKLNSNLEDKPSKRKPKL